MANDATGDAKPAGPFATLGGMRTGIAVMAVIMAAFALWALRTILTPLALALVLLVMIDGMARAIRMRAPLVPEQAALPAAIVFIVVAFAGAIWAIAANVGQFAAHSPLYTVKLDALLQWASARFGFDSPGTVRDLVQEVSPERYLGPAAHAVRAIGETAIFVLIYLGFLIAARSGIAAKAGALFPDPARRAEADRVFGRIRSSVESYIWVQTVVGLIIGAASAVVMAALGLSHVLFWAFVIFLASYIPVVGAAAGVLLPPLFGFLEFNDLWRPVLMLVLLEAVHFVVSHVIQPRMQGQSLNLDPIVILLALALWGLIWGLPGAFLSTPLTAIAMAILAEFASTRWIAVVLSSDGKPFGAN